MTEEELAAWHAGYNLTISQVLVTLTEDGLKVRGYGRDGVPSQAYLSVKGVGPDDAGAVLDNFLQLAQEPMWGPSSDAPHVFGN